MHFNTAIAAGVCLAGSTLAIDLDISDASSINAAAKTVAASIIDRYQNNGSDIPGLFGDPYYFWECGLAWDSLIHYWHQTGDDSYNGIVGEAIRWQLGDDNNFMPTNQTKSLGNDDQSTWALAAMSAAEYGFPSEALEGLDITWSDLAKNVFDSQAARWDNETCNGGLRWQIFSFNNGYNYKNSMTNGNFYQLAGRLARFTGNDTYALWGRSVFEWSFHVGLIADINSTAPGSVYDGTSVNNGCGDINHIQWTASAGTYLAGGAYIYNHTPTARNSNHQTFVPRINATFADADSGYGNGTLVEIACQPNDNCNVDQLAFRAVLARALAQTRALTDDPRVRRYTEPVNITNPRNISQADSVPAWTTHERIDFMLQQSAIGAASQCSGGPNGTTCGSHWGYSVWDGSSGLGQDLSALNIFLANIPIGKLATVNDTAGDAGGSRGALEDANDTITDAGDLIDAAGDAASDAASASGAARQVTMSSIALLVLVGSVMALL